jgi:hypothetical protein
MRPSGLDAVLKAVELPARISHLDASLPDVNAYDLPHLLWFLLLSFCLTNCLGSSEAAAPAGEES